MYKLASSSNVRQVHDAKFRFKVKQAFRQFVRFNSKHVESAPLILSEEQLILFTVPPNQLLNGQTLGLRFSRDSVADRPTDWPNDPSRLSRSYTSSSSDVTGSETTLYWLPYVSCRQAPRSTRHASSVFSRKLIEIYRHRPVPSAIAGGIRGDACCACVVLQTSSAWSAAEAAADAFVADRPRASDPS